MKRREYVFTFRVTKDSPWGVQFYAMAPPSDDDCSIAKEFERAKLNAVKYAEIKGYFDEKLVRIDEYDV